MRWLRPTDVTLVSPLPPAEVVRALAALVDEPRIVWPWQRPAKPFRGWIRGRRFEVGRASKLWNRSALPVVEGAIEPLGDGSAIRLTFRRVPAASLSMAMSLLVGALVSLAAIQVLFTTGVPDPFLLVAMAVPALFCWIAVSSFRREVRAAIRLLEPLGRPGAKRTRSLVRQ